MVVVNFPLRKGLMRYSRSALRYRNGRFIKKKDAAPAAAAAAAKAAPSEAEKRKALKFKLRHWLPMRNVQQKKARRGAPVIQKLRPSLVPGTVLILLAGRFAGKRVIYLKQLEKSGALLVTGPYRANGVPLRRINQAYVIATSTRMDISGIDLSGVTDKMFAKPKDKKVKKGEHDFFGSKTAEEKKKFMEEKRKRISPERKALQKQIDTALLERIKKVELLGDYLATRFTLKPGQYPHSLKF